MIKRGYLFVCIVIFSFTHAQQKYYESITSMKIAIKQNNYEEAYIILRGIKEQLSDFDKRTALDIYLKNNKRKPALKLIRELGEINYPVKYMLTKDSLVLKAITKEKFYREYNKGLKYFIVNYNPEFSQILTESRYLDQYVRINQSFSKLKSETDFLKETDLSNYKRIAQQINKYGFPTAKDVGYENLNNLSLILFHSSRYSDTIYTKVISYYKTAIENKNLQPIELGNLIDDHDTVIREKATTFGLKTQTSEEGQRLYEEKKITLLELMTDDKYTEFKPIKDIKNIDALRKKYFLPMIWQQAILNNIKELPKGYERKYD